MGLKRLPEAEAALDAAIAVLKARQEDLQKEETSEARDKELEEMDILVVDIEEAKVGLRDLVARAEQEGTPEGSASTKASQRLMMARLLQPSTSRWPRMGALRDPLWLSIVGLLC